MFPEPNKCRVFIRSKSHACANCGRAREYHPSATGPMCVCGHRKSSHRKRYGEQGQPRSGDCLTCGETTCHHFQKKTP